MLDERVLGEGKGALATRNCVRLVRGGYGDIKKSLEPFLSIYSRVVFPHSAIRSVGLSGLSSSPQVMACDADRNAGKSLFALCSAVIGVS